MTRLAITGGALLGLVGVATGAFGAHALKDRLDPALLEVWNTASRYALVHALALVATGLLAERRPSRAASVAGWSLLGGAVVFAGTLWLLALTGARWLGAITPLGGTALLVGWGALAVAGFGARSPEA